jgi:hypothetical protein
MELVRAAAGDAISPASEADRVTRAVLRGVCRMLGEMGWGALAEFRLPVGRRVDVMALSEAGRFAIIEVKSGAADYRADRKWREYLPFCEAFYFAVPVGFPLELLPAECGLIVADGYGAAIRRDSPAFALDPARKRRQLVRFAHAASARLQRALDPGV